MWTRCGRVLAEGDVQRSLLVRITRATTINDFAKLGTALGGTPTIVERLPRQRPGRHMTDDQLILLAVRPIFRAPTEGDRAPSSRTDRPGGVDGTHATVSSSLGNHARRWCGADSHGLLECGRRGFLRGCLDAGSPHAARLRATEVW